MSSEFNAAVTNYGIRNIKQQIIGKTSSGQNYAIIVNRVLWYKVRIFLDEDHLEHENRKLLVYFSSQHATWNGAMEKVSLTVAGIRQLDILCLLS